MTDARIAALEQKIAEAQTELQALKAGRVAPQQPPKDEGARVIPLYDERTDGVPNLREMERLFSAVKHLAPWPLNDKYDADRPFRGFSCCYRWISNKGRTEFPNPKFALSFWLDQCSGWLRDRNSMTSDVDATTLVLAVYASGDVAYCPSNSSLGHSWELALSEYAGRPASPDAWRRVLTGGAASILPPSSPARRMPVPSQVRIFGG